MKVVRLLLVLLLCAILPIGCAKQAEGNGYHLIVNGTEIPVEAFDPDTAASEVSNMVPIVSLFKGLGCETVEKDDTVEIRKNGSLRLILNLKAHTLYEPDNPEYNFFTLCPGDTGADFRYRRTGNELWICTHYVDSAFQLMGVPIDIDRGSSDWTMRINADFD